MLPAERHLQIIDLITKNGSVQVDELARILNVSLMTIRRDLEKLKQEGRIDRCHGGAVMKREVPYTQKLSQETEEKHNIALQCMKLIKKGSVIYLDAGTTTYEIAKLLHDISGITVITNDIELAHFLLDSSVNLIVCGGVVQKSTGSTIGAFAHHMMDNIRVDIAFMGAASIDDQFNVLTPTIDKAILKQTVCRNSKEKYLVVDDSKFGKQAFIKINHLSDYTAVITNKKFTNEENNRIRDMRVTIIST